MGEKKCPLLFETDAIETLTNNPYPLSLFVITLRRIRSFIYVNFLSGPVEVKVQAD
jgi:hypothetical protein